MYLLSLGFPSILNRTNISFEESVSIQVSDFGEKVWNRKHQFQLFPKIIFILDDTHSKR